MTSILEACKIIHVLEVGTSEIFHPSNFPPLRRASNFMKICYVSFILMIARKVDNSFTVVIARQTSHDAVQYELSWYLMVIRNPSFTIWHGAIAIMPTKKWSQRPSKYKSKPPRHLQCAYKLNLNRIVREVDAAKVNNG
jgi:hypothetical protein